MTRLLTADNKSLKSTECQEFPPLHNAYTHVNLMWEKVTQDTQIDHMYVDD